MSTKQISNMEQQDTLHGDNVSVLDILIVLAKHKKVILATTVTAAVLSGGASFVMHPVYQASTKLLPPQQSQSSAAAMLSQLGGIASMAVGSGGLKNPNDMYVGMLKSRTVADRLIAEYNLKKIYQTDSQEKARRNLLDSTTVASGKDGLITIDVEARDGKLAAAMANSYVNELFRLTKTLAVTEAAQRRVFYERQLETTKDNLAKAEMALKRTLDTRGVISVDVESRAILETVGRLRAQVSAKEIQLGSLRAFVTSTNPQYRRVEEELSSLRDELSRLENGRGSSDAAADKPNGLENVKLLRDLKYHQMLYELLAKQYEAARIDEAKDPSIIQVLDQAVEPERPVKPRRSMMVILSTIVGAVIGLFLAFIAEAKSRALNSAGGAGKWATLRKYLGFGKR